MLYGWQALLEMLFQPYGERKEDNTQFKGLSLMVEPRSVPGLQNRYYPVGSSGCHSSGLDISATSESTPAAWASHKDPEATLSMVVLICYCPAFCPQRPCTISH